MRASISKYGDRHSLPIQRQYFQSPRGAAKLSRGPVWLETDTSKLSRVLSLSVIAAENSLLRLWKLRHPAEGESARTRHSLRQNIQAHGLRADEQRAH